MHHGDDDGQLGDADHDSLLMNSSPWFDPSGNDFTLTQLIILYREIANDQDLMTLILTMVAIASCAMMTTMMTMPLMMTMLSMMMTGLQAWLVTARCAGDCRATSLRLRLASGQVDQPDDDGDDDQDDDDDDDDEDISKQADILLVGSQSRLRLTSHCFNCHPFWTGRSFNSTFKMVKLFDY